jgi:DNA-binding NarL/FixJ family response regulator
MSVALSVAVIAPAKAATRLARSLEAESLSVDAQVRSPQALAKLVGVAAVVLLANAVGAELVDRVRAVRNALPEARLVVVAPTTSLRQLRVLVAEGVDALVADDEVDRCLGIAVRSACAGQLSFPRSLGVTLGRPALSTREKQVLGLVVLGLTNGEIARKLHLSLSTVKTHLASAFTKLGARSRNEATALILDPESGLGPGILAITDGD